MVLETSKFRPCNISLLYQESKRKDIKRVLTHMPVVFTHVYEDSLFVRKLFVLLHFVVYPHFRAYDCRLSLLLLPSYGLRRNFIISNRRYISVRGLCQKVDYLLAFPCCPHKTNLTDYFFFSDS